MEKENCVEGFCFENVEEYKLALKEHETIQYVEKKLDKSNAKMVLSIYNKLLLEGDFTTIIGRCYLNNLYNIIVKSKVVKEEELHSITTIKDNKSSTDYYMYEIKARKEIEKNKKLQDTISNLKNTISRYKFVVVVFCVVLVALFIVIGNSDSINYIKTKNAVIDQYSSWEKELEAREKEIEEFEKVYGEQLDEYLYKQKNSQSE